MSRDDHCTSFGVSSTNRRALAYIEVWNALEIARPGTSVVAGSAVNLTMSHDVPTFVLVPDLLHHTITGAEATLALAALRDGICERVDESAAGPADIDG